MVQKIQLSEYLKRYDNMTAVERSEYMERAARWLHDSWPHLSIHMQKNEAQYQNVVTMSMGWNDEECKMFEEGAKLLSALVCVAEANTWLPDMLYVKSAKRAIRNMESEIFEAYDEWGRNRGEDQGAGSEKRSKEQGAGSKLAGDPTDANRKKRSNEQGAGVEKKGEEQGTGGKPMRPKHIDQYVHLLPEATQKRAAMVKDLLMQMDVAREKARLLMDAPDASGADLARWAKAATDCDKKVRAIYKELDDEWEKLVEQGRVVCDAVGNVRVVENEGQGARGEEQEKDAKDGGKTADGQPQREGEGQGARGEEQEAGSEKRDEEKEMRSEEQEEQKNTRRELRKWLTDTRRGNEKTRETHVRKWREKFTEYLGIEGEKAFEDEKIVEAAKHYGIEMGELRMRN